MSIGTEKIWVQPISDLHANCFRTNMDTPISNPFLALRPHNVTEVHNINHGSALSRKTLILRQFCQSIQNPNTSPSTTNLI